MNKRQTNRNESNRIAPKILSTRRGNTNMGMGMIQSAHSGQSTQSRSSLGQRSQSAMRSVFGAVDTSQTFADGNESSTALEPSSTMIYHSNIKQRNKSFPPNKPLSNSVPANRRISADQLRQQSVRTPSPDEDLSVVDEFTHNGNAHRGAMNDEFGESDVMSSYGATDEMANYEEIEGIPNENEMSDNSIDEMGLPEIENEIVSIRENIQINPNSYDILAESLPKLLKLQLRRSQIIIGNLVQQQLNEQSKFDQIYQQKLSLLYQRFNECADIQQSNITLARTQSEYQKSQMENLTNHITQTMTKSQIFKRKRSLRK